MISIVRLGAELRRKILNEVESRLDRPVAAGAVYATLDRLEAKGLCVSNSAAYPGAPGRAGATTRSALRVCAR